MNALVRLLDLVKNENMKHIFRKRTLIMVLLIFLIVLGISLINRSEITEENWEARAQQKIEDLRKDNEMYQEELKKGENSTFVSDFIELNEKEIKVLEYSLEHKIKKGVCTVWDIANYSVGVLAIINIFVISLLAISISSEFSEGTIRYLLIRPVERWRILLSKYASALLGGILLYAVCFVFSMILGSIFYGFNLNDSISLYIGSDLKVHEVSVVYGIAQEYLFSIISLMVLLSLSGVLSLILRRSTLAIIVSCAVIFGGSVATVFLSKYEWSKFVLFSILDLSQFMPGRTPITQDVTMNFALMMLAVYFIVFNTLSIVVFNKAEVT